MKRAPHPSMVTWEGGRLRVVPCDCWPCERRADSLLTDVVALGLVVAAAYAIISWAVG